MGYGGRTCSAEIVWLLLFSSLQWHPTPVLLPGKSHGRRSLVGCSPRGRWGSDMTERLHFHFSLSCIGEGNGNPLQCSCLEDPRDGGAWWAAVYGVAWSRTRLKWLSSSSSFEASAKHMENTGKVMFHILSQKDKMSWCELSILHLAWYTVGAQETAAAVFSLLLGGDVLSLSPVWLFVTPWTAARQALLSSTISQSWVKFMSIESVMLSNHLSLCRPLLLLPSIFPIIRIFPSDLALRIRWPKYWSFSISPSNKIQGWFPLQLTDLISLQSKGLSRVFSSTTIPYGRYHKDT